MNRRLVVDANRIFSALLKDGETRRAILTTDAALFAPRVLRAEIERHKNAIVRRTRGRKEGPLGRDQAGLHCPEPEVEYRDLLLWDTQVSQGTNPPEWKDIRAFCQEFGRGTAENWGEYGCGQDLNTSNHHYRDENDPRLPIEPEFRQAVKSEIVKYR